MNFDLTDEQQMLADTAREMFSRSYDTESRNKAVDSDLGWSREVWKQLAEIGILGLGFDPDEAGPIEVMAVMTEIGRRLAPEPVAAAALIPGAVIAAYGSDAQRALLDDVAAGDRLLAFAHTESGGRGSPELATRATEQGGSWTLTGRKTPVLAAQPLGAGGDATAHIEAAVIRFQSALCAEAVGAMDESLRLTTDYLKARKQFGVPLKTFQTLTQRASDMYVSLELARSMNFYAAMCVADGRFDPVAAARAKLQIGRSGRHIAQEAIQLHGGIGVTAEYPIAHYAARLTAIDQTFGSSTDQLRYLSGQVGNYGVAVL